MAGYWKGGDTSGNWKRWIQYVDLTNASGAYWHMHPSFSGGVGDEMVWDMCSYQLLTGHVPANRIGHYAPTILDALNVPEN
jgi:hypothetical protein